MRFSLILSFLCILSPGENWDLKKDENNIKVYTRKVVTSDFKELKCTTVVNSSLSSILKILTDADHFTNWIYKCMEGKELKRVGNTEVYSYQIFDVPWPYDDRDVVAKALINQDKKTKVVTVTSVLADNLVPEKKGVVRIRKFRTSYTLTPLQGGWVKIDYELGTEPGGHIPAWLANLLMVNGPFSTQQKMNQLLTLPYFKNYKFDFIAEPN